MLSGAVFLRKKKKAEEFLEELLSDVGCYVNVITENYFSVWSSNTLHCEQCLPDEEFKRILIKDKGSPSERIIFQIRNPKIFWKNY